MRKYGEKTPNPLVLFLLISVQALWLDLLQIAHTDAGMIVMAESHV